MGQSIEIKKITIRQVTNGYLMKVEDNSYRSEEFTANSIEGILIILFELQAGIREVLDAESKL